jgi:hypothetical protein
VVTVESPTMTNSWCCQILCWSAQVAGGVCWIVVGAFVDDGRILRCSLRRYDGVFQQWDWRRLPGITAAVDSAMLPCSYAQQLYNDSLVKSNHFTVWHHHCKCTSRLLHTTAVAYHGSCTPPLQLYLSCCTPQATTSAPSSNNTNVKE